MEKGLKYSEIELPEFAKRFSTEEECRKHLFNIRWPQGFVCPKCGNGEYYYLKARRLHQCKACKFQASITSGTILHKTRTSLVKWFWAIILIARQKSGISAKGLERLLAVSYPTAWLMSHKIRQAMTDRDAQYKLAGLIEMDESYFGGRKSGKRGRGAEGKAIVAVAVENRGKRAGFATMKVIDEATSDELAAVAQSKFVKGKCTVTTDKFKSYKYLDKLDFKHVAKKVEGKEAHKVLPWVHTFIGNVKSTIKGIFHSVSSKHLQRFLDECCYRFNRRFRESELFDRLLTACARTSTVTYAELTL